MDPKARIYSALELRWPSLPPEEEIEQLMAELIDFHVTAVEETPDGVRFFFNTPAERERAAGHLHSLEPAASIDAVDVSDENWAERSQASITAVRVGELVVAPPWDAPADASHVIVIQPSMGFGTAHHESTRLCLRLLQQLDVTGRRVLDVGTGSGVLAIAAVRRGAASALAVDYDPDALENARENVELNRVGAAVTVSQVDLSDAGAFKGETFGLVFANLTGGLLRRFAAQLAALVAAEGYLITSGFTREEEAGVQEAMRAAGLCVQDLATEGDWSGICWRHKTEAR